MGKAVPHGMTEVPKEVFWAKVMAEKRNIHPSSERGHTNWRFVNSHSLWGWTSRGFVQTCAEPEVFALTNAALARVQGGAA